MRCVSFQILNVIVPPYYSATCEACFTTDNEVCTSCSDPNATNYGELGECYYHGCTDPNSCNYNPYATPGNPLADNCLIPVPGV